jgi:DNA-3-methyladenine glycosylase
MFGPPGHAYVYFTYGMHHCLNVVAGAEGRAAAVLVRAVAPERGLALMRARRGGVPDPRLARGPGCVAQAFGLDRSHDGLDLTRGPLWISDAPRAGGGLAIVAGPRVGIRAGLDRRWRFAFAGHPAVSGPRPARRRPPADPAGRGLRRAGRTPGRRRGLTLP